MERRSKMIDQMPGMKPMKSATVLLMIKPPRHWSIRKESSTGC
ncbi:hypothetical protein AH02_28 [Pseudomonas phage AH02]|nr:hypothetical protein AH02_28 [Pseudomonas phage AH02]